MRNEEIRKHARNKKVMLWQIANELGISEPTMTRKLRNELASDERVRIMQIIEKISEEQR